MTGTNGRSTKPPDQHKRVQRFAADTVLCFSPVNSAVLFVGFSRQTFARASVNCINCKYVIGPRSRGSIYGILKDYSNWAFGISIEIMCHKWFRDLFVKVSSKTTIFLRIVFSVRDTEMHTIRQYESLNLLLSSAKGFELRRPELLHWIKHSN